MKDQIPLFRSCSLSGIWRRLKQLGISWQRGRHYVHSPDEAYAEKVAYIMSTKNVSDQPLAHTTIGSTLKRRIAGLLNLHTGSLIFIHKSTTRINNLINLYERACEQYEGKRLYIIVDNWPVHYHPDIIACLEPQRSPFKYRLPKSWAELEAKPKYTNRKEKLPIQLLSLPTYASWLNPIEKVWRRLKDQVIHLHSFAQDFPKLQENVIDRLGEWEQGSDAMLKYCGLLNQKGIYTEARDQFVNTTL